MAYYYGDLIIAMLKNCKRKSLDLPLEETILHILSLNLCNKEDDISHMLFTCVMVRNVWKDVSNILQCELKLEHIILYHNENYHCNMDNELINYCISEVAYSIYKFWLKNINNKIKGTSLDLRNYIVSSIKYKAVLMTEIQTANENVRQCLEYLCEKLNNVGTKRH